MYHAPPPRPLRTVEARSAPDRVTVVDIGARGGLHPRWRDCSIVVQGVGFDAEECARLNARGDGVRYLPYALGSKDGAKATLYITDSPGSSSLLEPNRKVLNQFLYGSRISVTATAPAGTPGIGRPLRSRIGRRLPSAMIEVGRSATAWPSLMP